MDLSNDEEATIISRTHAEYSSVATNGEKSILIALARVRSSILRNAGLSKTGPKPAGEAKKFGAIGLLFPEYAHILRQTIAWGKISEHERGRMERELLTLPEK